MGEPRLDEIVLEGIPQRFAEGVNTTEFIKP